MIRCDSCSGCAVAGSPEGPRGIAAYQDPRSEGMFGNRLADADAGNVAGTGEGIPSWRRKTLRVVLSEMDAGPQ